MELIIWFLDACIWVFIGMCVLAVIGWFMP